MNKKRKIVTHENKILIEEVSISSPLHLEDKQLIHCESPCSMKLTYHFDTKRQIIT